MEKYYNLTSVKDKGVLNVSIDEELGFFGTNSEDFKTLLDDNKDIPVHLDINSGGGSLFQGIAIFNILKSHPQPVSTNVTGVAGSASSLIFMAGEQRTMAIGSHLMIHKPQFSPFIPQDADDLRQVADNLDKFQDSIIDIYATVVNISHEEIEKMVNAETWINATEAQEMGFSTGMNTDLAVSNTYEIGQYVNQCSTDIPKDALKYFKNKDKNIQQVLNELENLIDKEVDMKPEDFENRLAGIESKLDEKFSSHIKTLTDSVTNLTDSIKSKEEENKGLTTLVNGLSAELVDMRRENTGDKVSNFIDSLIQEGRIPASTKEAEIKNVLFRTGDDRDTYKNELKTREKIVPVGEHDIITNGYTPKIDGDFNGQVQEEIKNLKLDRESTADDIINAARRTFYKNNGGQ